jgi:hypothetical protein
VEEEGKGNNLISLIDAPEGKRDIIKHKFSDYIQKLVALQQ